MEEQTISRIKRYLNKKINPKVIALELGVSLELVEKCEKELLQEERKQQEDAIRQQPKSKVNHNSSTMKTSYLKMKVLRDKYEKAYNPDKEENATKQISEVTELPKNKLQEAEILIDAIEEKSAKIAKASKQESRTIARELIEDAKKLQPLQPLPLELAIRFKNAMTPIQIFKQSGEDKIPLVINNVKRMAAERLIQSVDILQRQTEDIEELKRILIMLTPDIERQNKLLVGRIKSQIQRKIQEEQQKKALEKIKNIPPNLSKIIESVASGEIDIQAAIQTIEHEVIERVAAKTQKRSFMVPSEEQEKRQIVMQILNAIRENPDKYQFKNPDLAIEQIQAICGAEKGETIRTIVTNLIGRKHFETAKRICRKFSVDNNDALVGVYINRLFQDIKSAEVANTVLEAIKMKGTPEEQAAYYDSIEIQLKKEGINPLAVSLGTNYNGTKQIKLSDIWLPEGKNKNETHR